MSPSPVRLRLAFFLTALVLAAGALAVAWPVLGLRSAAAQTPDATEPPVIREGVPPVVEVVKLNGVVDRPVADYLLGALADAEATGSTVVLQLDTPGALGIDPVDLAERVFEARVPVVVWVDTPPASAAGVGLLLVYASSYAVTSPGAGVGPLLPLDQAHKAAAEDPAEAGRALERIGAWAQDRDRDPTFARDGVAAPAQEVLDRGVVQDVAISLRDLLERIDGEEVPTADGPVELRTDPDATVLRFHDLGLTARLLHATAAPVTIYVLLVMGIAGLAFELTQSGVGMAGILGLIAVGFAIYGLAVVPFDPLGLALLLGGHVLLILDVQLHRLGYLSLLGMAGFVAGSVLVFRRVGPAVDISPWLIWPAAVAAILYYGFALTVAQKARERITTTQRGLVGLVGEARGMLAPDGPVYVKGTLWRGKALDGPIPPGTRVRVRGVEGLILRVEPEPPPDTPNGS